MIDEERKIKKGRFLFKLTRTVNQENYQSSKDEPTPLLKLADERHHFVLEQKRKRRRSSSRDQGFEDTGNETSAEQDDIPPEISEMIERHLRVSELIPEDLQRKRKPSKKHFTGEAVKVVTIPSLDYVYDIYHLEKVPETEFNTYKGANDVGFVKIVDSDINLIPDEDSDSQDKVRSDDEDSNEENYYQNDYPEDEDDDRSVLFGSEVEATDAPETTLDGQSDSYNALFDLLGENQDIVSSLNPTNFVDLDEFYDDRIEGAPIYEETDDLHRNDDEDPLAAYRERIFGQLQKMIDES